MLLRKQCEAHLKQAETKLTQLQPANETSDEAQALSFPQMLLMHPNEYGPMTADLSVLKQSIEEAAKKIEATLDQMLPPQKDGKLTEAMRYAVLGGGKRMRGYLVLESSRILGVDESIALRAAASIECLHTYSLIHDDLPCMDDDDLRRGKPSTHKKFDEATAVLAADALQTMAFEIILKPSDKVEPANSAALAYALAQASGRSGMVGGQALDLDAEGRKVPLDEIRQIHAWKTGALIRYSAEAGAILAGLEPTNPMRISLVKYGEYLGTAFQVADDILDATASTEELGKTAGKDEASGKSTYVGELGLDGARKEAEELVKNAQAALRNLEPKADNLSALAEYVIQRRS